MPTRRFARPLRVGGRLPTRAGAGRAGRAPVQAREPGGRRCGRRCRRGSRPRPRSGRRSRRRGGRSGVGRPGPSLSRAGNAAVGVPEHPAIPAGELALKVLGRLVLDRLGFRLGGGPVRLEGVGGPDREVAHDPRNTGDDEPLHPLTVLDGDDEPQDGGGSEQCGRAVGEPLRGHVQVRRDGGSPREDGHQLFGEHPQEHGSQRHDPGDLHQHLGGLDQLVPGGDALAPVRHADAVLNVGSGAAGRLRDVRGGVRGGEGGGLAIGAAAAAASASGSAAGGSSVGISARAGAGPGDGRAAPAHAVESRLGGGRRGLPVARLRLPGKARDAVESPVADAAAADSPKALRPSSPSGSGRGPAGFVGAFEIPGAAGAAAELGRVKTLGDAAGKPGSARKAPPPASA